MKKLTRKIVALTLSLVMCISFSNTTFAYADNENISSSAEASKVNWWKIGWIILSDYVEKLIDLDGQSEKDSSWAYLVSPSIEYNTGDMGPEVYFRPEVDNSVGSIRMHGHRIIFVDIFTQIALILSDASGKGDFRTGQSNHWYKSVYVLYKESRRQFWYMESTVCFN